MNLGQLRTEVKILLRKHNTTADDDTGDPKNAEINSAINEARNLIYNEISATVPQRFGASTTVSYTAAAESVAMPSAASRRRIIAVYDSTDSTVNYPLRAGHIAEFPNMVLSGIPEKWVVLGANIYLRPRPTGARTLTIIHVPLLTELSLNADEPSEFPADQHRTIAQLAAFSILDSNGDDNAAGMERRYNRSFAQLLKAMNSMVGDDVYIQQAPPGAFEVI